MATNRSRWVTHLVIDPQFNCGPIAFPTNPNQMSLPLGGALRRYCHVNSTISSMTDTCG